MVTRAVSVMAAARVLRVEDSARRWPRGGGRERGIAIGEYERGCCEAPIDRHRSIRGTRLDRRARACGERGDGLGSAARGYPHSSEYGEPLCTSHASLCVDRYTTPKGEE
jgi:hypothetical protein